MKGVSWGLIVGVTVGVVIGILLTAVALFCNRLRKRNPQIGNGSSRRASTVPIRTNGVDVCTALSDSTTGQESPRIPEENSISLWIEGHKRKRVISKSGIPKYAYKDLQKATCNFTTLIGQGAFGPVYKAQMSTGEIVAVKVLATDSKQGEKEFQTEVFLLGRLHHRNLVNLVGYCAEKGQHMLIYVYMENGSLASHLYNENKVALSWDLRINIALDVARGLEYLHDGAIPSVVHRDIKSSNILLDRTMRARVADFGLSREEIVSRNAPIRGTYGYLDPEYVCSRSFTKKSDVYSFGVLLFELIAGRTPQQGLLEHVELEVQQVQQSTSLSVTLAHTEKKRIAIADPSDPHSCSVARDPQDSRSALPLSFSNIEEVALLLSHTVSRLQKAQEATELSPSSSPVSDFHQLRFARASRLSPLLHRMQGDRGTYSLSPIARTNSRTSPSRLSSLLRRMQGNCMVQSSLNPSHVSRRVCFFGSPLIPPAATSPPCLLPKTERIETALLWLLITKIFITYSVEYVNIVLCVLNK